MSVDLSNIFDEQGLLEDDGEMPVETVGLIKSVVARAIGYEETTPTAKEATSFIEDMLKLSASMNDALEFEATQAMASLALDLIDQDQSNEDSLTVLQVPIHLVNAEAARGLEDFDSAINSCRSAVKLLSDSAFPMEDKRRKMSLAGAYMDITQTALSQENGDRAIKAAQAALSIYDAFQERLYMGKAHEQLAEAQSLLGDRAEAISSMNKAIQLYADAQEMAALSSGFSRLSELQMNDRNWEAGEKALLAALTAVPKDGRSMEYEGAMLVLVRLVKAKPERREILTHRIAEIIESNPDSIRRQLVEFEKMSDMGLGGFK